MASTNGVADVMVIDICVEIALVSERLLFNVKWAIFQLYNGEQITCWWNIDDACFVLDQHVQEDSYTTLTQKKCS